jgi:hypothetical protein
MKWASDYSKKVGIMLCSKLATAALATLVMSPGQTIAQAQIQGGVEPSNMPACSGVGGPAIDLRTQTHPALERESEVEVGQVLLDATPVVIRAGTLELKSPATFSGRFLFTDFTVTIPAGPVVTDAAGNHRPAAYEVKYGSERSPRTGSGRPSVRLEVDEGGTQLSGILEVSGARRYPIEGASFAITECYLTTSERVRKQLTYVGVSRGIITVEYRELAGNLVRQAFTRTLTYDLAEGDVIGVQGARLRVISADNVCIRYVVLRAFSE